MPKNDNVTTLSQQRRAQAAARAIAQEGENEAAVERGDFPEIPDIAFTHNGVDYVIDGDAFDDVEFILAIQKGNEVVATERILGEVQFRKWLASSRQPNGRVPLTAFRDLMQSVQEARGAGN